MGRKIHSKLDDFLSPSVDIKGKSGPLTALLNRPQDIFFNWIITTGAEHEKGKWLVLDD